MKVSLIIASYNRGPAIGSTLASVLNLKLPVDEVILVDDGSTDDTAEFVAEHFPEARLLTKSNGGTSSARNAGAAAAKHEWLMFLDHDDLLLPNAVSVLAALSDMFPQAGSVHADHIYDGRSNGVYHPNHHQCVPAFQRLLDTEAIERADTARMYGYPLYRSLLRGNLIQQPFAIRKSVFEDVGGYSEDIRYCEDWDLYLRVAQKYPIAVSDEVISVHVIEGENLHLSAAEKQNVMYEKVLRGRGESHRWCQFAENRIVREKLAAIYKSQGDSAWRTGMPRTAWRRYLDSALSWPFDHVVLARLLLWAARAVTRKGPTETGQA